MTSTLTRTLFAAAGILALSAAPALAKSGATPTGAGNTYPDTLLWTPEQLLVQVAGKPEPEKPSQDGKAKKDGGKLTFDFSEILKDIDIDKIVDGDPKQSPTKDKN